MIRMAVFLALLAFGQIVSGQVCVSGVCSTVQPVQKIVQQPAKQVVQQQQEIYSSQQPQQLIEEQVVVEGDNSEVLFFVSPEFRRNQLYPERQELVVQEELLLAVRELRTLLLEIRDGQQQAVQPTTPPPPVPAMEQSSAVRSNCVIGVNGQACHGGAQPASSFNLAGNSPVSDEWFRRSLEELVAGTMPKDRELDQMTKNRVLIELLSRKP